MLKRIKWPLVLVLIAVVALGVQSTQLAWSDAPPTPDSLLNDADRQTFDSLPQVVKNSLEQRFIPDLVTKGLSQQDMKPVFPILGVFRLNGQPKRDDGMIFGSCKARQSPVYPIRDAFLAVNHASCPSLSSSGPRQWGESALKTSRLPGALSLLAKSWLYPPSAWRRR